MTTTRSDSTPSVPSALELATAAGIPDGAAVRSAAKLIAGGSGTPEERVAAERLLEVRRAYDFGRNEVAESHARADRIARDEAAAARRAAEARKLRNRVPVPMAVRRARAAAYRRLHGVTGTNGERRTGAGALRERAKGWLVWAGVLAVLVIVLARIPVACNPEVPDFGKLVSGAGSQDSPEVVSVSTSEAPAVVEVPGVPEDDPSWDCRTMGNRMCGPVPVRVPGDPALECWTEFNSEMPNGLETLCRPAA